MSDRMREVLRSATAPTPTTVRRARRGLRRKLALFAASLAFALLTLEVFVRIFGAAATGFPRSALAAPGVFTCRMKPDGEFDVPLLDGGGFHVKTNARGFRGATAASISARPLRILSLGDSFTLGWGVDLEEHAMARFVAEYRRVHPNRDVGHAYVAHPDWDPKDYWFAYLTEGRAANPDLVVLGLFAGNDVMPAGSPRYRTPKDAPSRDAPPAAPPPPLLRSFEWVRTRLSSSLLVARVGLWAGYKPANFARFEPDVATQREAWATTFFYLDALDIEIRRNGGQLVIVSYPSLIQVNASHALDAAGFDHAAPDRVLSAFCAERRIEMIPLLEPLIAANQHLDLYFPKDRHLTARGNAVAAEALTGPLGAIVDRVWDEKSRR